MLPAAPGKGLGSPDPAACGPAPPGNTKDIIMIYEEDAEEWALYLTEVFLHVVQREAILLYRLENFSFRHLELLNLTSYKCKLLILSNSLLKDLTPKKCQFLEKILHSPESVVTLLCGVMSSHQLYELLNISQSRWEISTEQEPEDYISVIQSIIFKDSEDYLEVNIPTDLQVKHSGEVSERKEIEELPEASRNPVPLAVVLPAEIPCENPGEIFIILRDEVIGDTVEVEFTSNNKRIRTRPALWSKKVWCMKALEFPAGSVHVNVYCDGIIKATTKIKYYPTAKAKECLFRMADSGDSLCQNGIEELDGVLTSLFKHEIPYYEFQSLQTEICSQNKYIHFKELPTLLHCAAKFGLKNLAIHLLQCSGATWASKMKNMEGSDPAHIAERHGHKELKKIFEDFSIQEIDTNNEQENDYEEDIASFSTYIPSTQNPACHHESRKTYRQSADVAEASEMEGEGKENGSDMEAKHSPLEVGSESSEDQYDDLYVFIPGADPENNSQEPLMSSRPPLPPPRPVATAFQLERPHFTLPVFQQKTARRQSDDDKFRGLPKKQDRARIDSPASSTLRGCLTDGQEELILLQEKVKNGKMSMDEALEKFKHWQMGKSGLEMIQQEKLRQLRDCIIGKRPEEENVYNKLTIVHHPVGKETVHNENMFHNIPFSNKLPAQPQVEKEFGFCCKKDH
ncbi:PREDICTED: B-cell scaffold protein with ankyrin repeats isoform X4 [Cercocebus atys]|uniref:B-cell scaffold protein with ankyrin repeats isoform X4 n=1 Tax=Cercocebus atys TaxID=9531 RepID=UPI0005F4A55D|nr:PREDICTED: B-cell scaffold protein with ankyrin repeats isoform X4 [Cercocebus atys]